VTAGSREVANWLVGALALLAFLILGRPLLVPLVFALLIWAILNAIADALVRFNVPRWVAWTGSLALLLVGIYLLTLIIGNEAAQLAADAPGIPKPIKLPHVTAFSKKFRSDDHLKDQIGKVVDTAMMLRAPDSVVVACLIICAECFLIGTPIACVLCDLCLRPDPPT